MWSAASLADLYVVIGVRRRRNHSVRNYIRSRWEFLKLHKQQQFSIKEDTQWPSNLPWTVDAYWAMHMVIMLTKKTSLIGFVCEPLLAVDVYLGRVCCDMLRAVIDAFDHI